MLAEIFSEWGIIAILVVVVILFGSTQLPKFARSLGSAQSEFKKGLAEGAKADGESKGTDTESKASDTESADAKKD
jgi:sec-independent protein translocase protein TatA